MTIEERTTGLEAKPDISGRRVGLDELRRRDLHHPAAGRPRDHRARDRGGDRARGRGLRRRPRGQRGALARAGHPAAAAADQPRLRRARAGSTPRPRRSTRCSARCRAATFWTVTCIGRHHQRMLGAGAAARRARDPHRARGRRLPAPRRARAVERRAGRDGGRPGRRARARGRHPGADPGAACSLAEPGATAASPPGLGRALVAPPRPRDPRGDPRAAIELFARLGYHATSMRAIAVRGRRAAGGDLPLVPEQGGDPGRSSRTTSWSG